MKKKRKKEHEKKEEDNTIARVSIPYTKGLSKRISREMRKHKIETIHKPTTTLKKSFAAKPTTDSTPWTSLEQYIRSIAKSMLLIRLE